MIINNNQASWLLARLLLMGLLLMLSAQLWAHNRSESFTSWQQQDSQLSYSFSVLRREATRLAVVGSHRQAVAALMAQHIDNTLSVYSISPTGERLDCAALQPATALQAADAYLTFEGQFHCDVATPLFIENNSFFDVVSAHSHYARVRYADEKIQELLFSDGLRVRQLAVGDVALDGLGQWQVFAQYLAIGAEHISEGLDHLAFLLALLLLASNWRQIVYLVSGFTLGHSISLVLAVLGFAMPNALMVEALIGFSIALVAIQTIATRKQLHLALLMALPVVCLGLAAYIAWLGRSYVLLVGVLGAALFAASYLSLTLKRPESQRLRLLVTAMFGVVHGFGFAGGLLEAQFSSQHVAFVLAGFNLGVELGQLLLIGLALLLARLVRPMVGVDALVFVREGLCAILAALGIFWFVARLAA